MALVTSGSASSAAAFASRPAQLLAQLCTVRQQSLALCEPLTPEDMMVQSCPEASPAKWHLAHTSWFFETFLLREFLPGYKPFHPDFLWLFNSYYNAVSAQPQKKLRASFSRPGIASILEYRAHVDAGLQALFSSDAPEEAQRRLVLGLHHEQQHGELMLTDIKNAFWSNPLRPAYRDGALPEAHRSILRQLGSQNWVPFAEGLRAIGHTGDGFCFDNEEPRHRVWLDAFDLASRPVSSAEYLQFMEDGGYTRSELWLSEGWDTVQREQWEAPLYWHRESGEAEWTVFTLRGEQPLRNLLAAPVCHISYFEANAFARWAGMQLPTEAEWEVAAAESHLAATPEKSLLLEGDSLHPLASLPEDGSEGALREMLGNVWEWTGSAYLGYPGYAALPGALGEYNGKFMSNQMVLRGGSVATPLSHIRASYRNFFPPHTRWQFSGVRLARHQ
ncbi:ergothioneine biosynthesis protein EgtB [Acidipila sp. EB88]|uniref:ergothioneine biosynthesis protein EgtB n=1 Tax=Acidipila sp. EB88 TaxID=2305226 RepID=UPI000F5D61DE|nr:ergothioneine biosynthesis protein EgtB [Acidipila sp. EB88]RRA48617.1 ergothioneine biosynthesis protein EgtB [Acidipila sp. EB88]